MLTAARDEPRQVAMADQLEVLAAQLEVPGVDREAARAALQPHINDTELQVIARLAAQNPGAWQALCRFITKESLKYVLMNGEIGFHMTPEDAFGKVQWNAGAAKALALLAADLLPEKLQQRLDKLAKTNDNGRVSNNDFDQRQVSTGRGTQWISAVG